MKTINYIYFYSIFFTLYGLLNYYLFIRGAQALPANPAVRAVYTAVFLTLALAFIAGRTLENYWLSPVSETLTYIGSLWLAVMLYGILSVFLLDILRLLNYFFGIFPSFITSRYNQARQIAGLIIAGGTLLAIAAGFINGLRPRIRELDIDIPKTVYRTTSLRIAVASDIHLGTIIGKNRFERIVGMINRINPDLILLPGDIVDEDLAPVVKEDIGSSLRKLKSRYGVYAVTGNHEYIGGVEPACRYLAEHAVTILRDTLVRLANGIYIAGREDRSSGQFAGRRRKPLEEILKGIDRSSPLILMDHQPFKLEEAEDNSVDLQLSGHTHHGQLWPLNYITSAVYEMSWGYLRKGSTQYYVSCGVGTWGPPVRTGNRPEIIAITLNFTGPTSPLASSSPE